MSTNNTQQEELKIYPDRTKNNENLALKIAEFGIAMEKYKNNRFYSHLELIVSVLIMFFQALTLFYAVKTYNGSSLFTMLSAFILAYIITDFVNGIAHMYMDNNTRYASIVGPFISSFHLHHSNPKYTKQHPVKVYFYASGIKFWLLGYLLALYGLQKLFTIEYGVNVFFVSVGILSSIAEVSHYWCHMSTNKTILILQKYRILLSKQHHKHHHCADNTHYAFLNGITDPILNVISRYYYSGYKNNADKHTDAYKKSAVDISLGESKCEQI